MEWAESVYQIVAQLRRAAVSVAVNIAEGRGRFHVKEQHQFFDNARGSLFEVVTLLKLSTRLGYVDHRPFTAIEKSCGGISGKLATLIHALKSPQRSVHSPTPQTPHPTPS